MATVMATDTDTGAVQPKKTNRQGREAVARPGVLRAVLVLPVSLAVAGIALIHAASENGVVPLAMAGTFHSTLNAEMQNRLVDVGFRSQIAQAKDGNVQFVAMSDELASQATDAYKADPLKIQNLRTLALGRVLHTQDSGKAREVLEAASVISRRDPMTNMWLVQEYGRAGDLDRLLSTFDRALRTSRRVREAAMAPLVNILTEPQAHEPIGELLQNDPEWAPEFWSEFARNEIALDNAEAFFADSPVKFAQVPADAREAILANLKRTRRYGTLFRLAAQLPDSEISTHPAQDGTIDVATRSNPFGWQLQSTGNFSANVNRRSGVLEIDARAGSFGMVADRIMTLRGSNTVRIVMADPVPETARLDMIVKCAGADGSELARIVLGAGDTEGQARFSAGACEFTSLQLSFDVDEGRRDALLRVASISVGPAAAS